jgi:hypothetical protein
MTNQSSPLTLILSHQGRGKKEKQEKVRVRVKTQDGILVGCAKLVV